MSQLWLSAWPRSPLETSVEDPTESIEVVLKQIWQKQSV
jgi:hypothetical protein